MGTVKHFFLGANSGRGFQNLFNRFCESEEHYDLLILKGGPGAGKSTMMKKIGTEMEARGEDVEYFYCSGDPDSLDGVHIPRIRTAVLDGTSPHVLEPKYPAAVARYVNLGQFYDIEAAKAARDEIITCTDRCSDAYRRAYRAFSAAGSLEDSASELLREGFDYDRLMRRTEGIISREIKGRGGGEGNCFRFLGSLTYKGGIWRFDTVESICPRVYHLCDSSGLAAPMLDRIYHAAHARGYGAVICPDGEHTDQMQHLLLPELGVAFVTTKADMECPCSAYRRIHLDEMVSKSHRKRWKGRVSFLRKMAKTLREEGVETLNEAKKFHDALEQVYRPHVDFAGVDQLTTLELERIKGY